MVNESFRMMLTPSTQLINGQQALLVCLVASLRSTKFEDLTRSVVFNLLVSKQFRHKNLESYNFEMSSRLQFKTLAWSLQCLKSEPRLWMSLRKDHFVRGKHFNLFKIAN